MEIFYLIYSFNEEETWSFKNNPKKEIKRKKLSGKRKVVKNYVKPPNSGYLWPED